MEPKLKECPFCGEEPVMCEDDNYCQIDCTTCYYHLSELISDKDELIKKWNKRVIILR